MQGRSALHDTTYAGPQNRVHLTPDLRNRSRRQVAARPQTYCGKGGAKDPCRRGWARSCWAEPSDCVRDRLCQDVLGPAGFRPAGHASPHDFFPQAERVPWGTSSRSGCCSSPPNGVAHEWHEVRDFLCTDDAVLGVKNAGSAGRLCLVFTVFESHTPIAGSRFWPRHSSPRAL
jgi:hypothetical protein